MNDLPAHIVTHSKSDHTPILPIKSETEKYVEPIYGAVVKYFFEHPDLCAKRDKI